MAQGEWCVAAQPGEALRCGGEAADVAATLSGDAKNRHGGAR